MHTIEVFYDHIVSPQHQVSFSDSSILFLVVFACTCLLFLSIQALDMENPLIVNHSSMMCPSSSIPSDYCSNVYGEVVPMEKNIIINILLITRAIITLFFLLDSSPETCMNMLGEAHLHGNLNHNKEIICITTNRTGLLCLFCPPKERRGRSNYMHVIYALHSFVPIKRSCSFIPTNPHAYLMIFASSMVIEVGVIA